MAVMDDDHAHATDDDLAGPPAYNRDDLEYDLIVRQEPKQARMCGVGTKADRRPIDPPPVVQLRVIDKGTRSRRSGSPDDRAHYNQSFLQNPYYFMYASLASPERDEELHLLKDGKTRCTTGSVVSSLYHLKDPEADGEGRTGRDAGFFVFPDLSVRTEGTYRLKLTLFEVIGANVHHCKSIFSAPFYVYTAKKFPGMEESTNLSCALADQGIKIRIRKDVRVRKRAIDPNWFQPVHRDGGESDVSDDEGGRDPKRPRNEAGPPPPPPAAPPPVSASSISAAGAAGGTWGTIDPSLPPSAAPPPPPPPSAPDHTQQFDARAFNPTAPAPAPAPSAAPTPASAPGTSHPEYHPPQPHQHAPYMPPPPHPGGMYPGAYGWGPVPPPPPPHPHAQGYGAYPGYDHHRAHPYGAPPAMHYGAPPPPYGYYDQHGQYGHPPPAAQPQQPAQAQPQHQQQQQQQGESPRSAGSQAAQQAASNQQQSRGKDAYPPPPPTSAVGMMPPPGSYAAQEYAYGRPPPVSSASAPAQTRPYHPSPGPAPGPPPQSAPAPGTIPNGYSPQPQGHMGHYMPTHQPYGYASTGEPYAAAHQQQQQAAAHQHPQAQQQWGYAPGPPTPFASYGRPGPAPAWGAPPGDAYAYAQTGAGAGAGASGSASGYVRPGPEENGRRSPPVPSISGQARGYGPPATATSPQRSNSLNSGSASANGGGTSADRIQLAPLRQTNPADQAHQHQHQQYANSVSGAAAAAAAAVVLGKKNPLSIGSIISDES